MAKDNFLALAHEAQQKRDWTLVRHYLELQNVRKAASQGAATPEEDLAKFDGKAVVRSNEEPKQWLLGTGDIFRFAGHKCIIRSIDFAASMATLERINLERWPIEFIKVPINREPLSAGAMPDDLINGTALYRECLDLPAFKSVLERQASYVEARVKQKGQKTGFTKRCLKRFQNQLKALFIL
jgi:hypothetical protein